MSFVISCGGSARTWGHTASPSCKQYCNSELVFLIANAFGHPEIRPWAFNPIENRTNHGKNLSQGFNTTDCVGLTDLAIHRPSTLYFSKQPEPQYECFPGFLKVATEPQKLWFCPQLSQLTFQVFALRCSNKTQARFKNRAEMCIERF